MSLAVAHPPGPDARTRILDATEAIIRARGVAGLTLEAAAKEAGVSKGGLLYHFAGKETLLHALLGRMAEWMRQDFAATVERQPEGPGRIARAMLDWGFGAAPGVVDERCDRAAAVFLACFHHDPALLDPARAVVAEIRAAIATDGLPPGHGQVIMAATDGLFMARIFNLYTPSPAELGAMHATLARLLETSP
ncbi:TetR/AcrR family transcriptional regulator [Siccirubricoccus sp. KC 17139]|uniref:TetR/AcrR family transcriptional regulator n=1 Tax=Siccirubricoccus soli TaxID=2899147 RepID=A0ABT1DDP1_9PROT|nr:TetR/AcrR family transcriptional regulator [Siccirubricoccus soli]MCO6419350.1 TetR/AcrR family transcriptional regulator [Siccirubricoccus soli]MCP2685485.1 TetR/AcrR family transcriptional regulator [Siccirubricoccus soli]